VDHSCWKNIQNTGLQIRWNRCDGRRGRFASVDPFCDLSAIEQLSDAIGQIDPGAMLMQLRTELQCCGFSFLKNFQHAIRNLRREPSMNTMSQEKHRQTLASPSGEIASSARMEIKPV
jgi:hypothetical protein